MVCDDAYVGDAFFSTPRAAAAAAAAAEAANAGGAAGGGGGALADVLQSMPFGGAAGGGPPPRLLRPVVYKVNSCCLADLVPASLVAIADALRRGVDGSDGDSGEGSAPWLHQEADARPVPTGSSSSSSGNDGYFGSTPIHGGRARRRAWPNGIYHRAIRMPADLDGVVTITAGGQYLYVAEPPTLVRRPAAPIDEAADVDGQHDGGRGVQESEEERSRDGEPWGAGNGPATTGGREGGWGRWDSDGDGAGLGETGTTNAGVDGEPQQRELDDDAFTSSYGSELSMGWRTYERDPNTVLQETYGDAVLWFTPPPSDDDEEGPAAGARRRGASDAAARRRFDPSLYVKTTGLFRLMPLRNVQTFEVEELPNNDDQFVIWMPATEPAEPPPPAVQLPAVKGSSSPHSPPLSSSSFSHADNGDSSSSTMHGSGRRPAAESGRAFRESVCRSHWNPGHARLQCPCRVAEARAELLQELLAEATQWREGESGCFARRVDGDDVAHEELPNDGGGVPTTGAASAGAAMVVTAPVALPALQAAPPEPWRRLLTDRVGPAVRGIESFVHGGGVNDLDGPNTPGGGRAGGGGPAVGLGAVADDAGWMRASSSGGGGGGVGLAGRAWSSQGSSGSSGRSNGGASRSRSSSIRSRALSQHSAELVDSALGGEFGPAGRLQANGFVGLTGIDNDDGGAVVPATVAHPPPPIRTLRRSVRTLYSEGGEARVTPARRQRVWRSRSSSPASSTGSSSFEQLQQGGPLLSSG
ncbi:hypothetical protein HK405_014916, partial [Cladochytrium tenue]